MIDRTVEDLSSWCRGVGGCRGTGAGGGGARCEVQGKGEVKVLQTTSDPQASLRRETNLREKKEKKIQMCDESAGS